MQRAFGEQLVTHFPMQVRIDGMKTEGFRKLGSQPTRVCMPPSTGMTAPVM
jgi:hypothetical protein